MTLSLVDKTVSPKKKGGNLYVNIFAPIASIVAFSLVVVGLYVLAKKKGYTFQSLKRNRSVDTSNEDLPAARKNTNNMELGNH